ncbi:hypothetical protein AMJ49_00215 [Parcubacteria bacterium DG_74_2]|nr:MAG: hypothetical protein AMJ49_00215 [Parcubacteria bacterium DG_74_2]
MLQEKREKFKKIEVKTGQIFSKLGLTPNQLTLISVLFAFISVYFLIKIELISALIFYFVAAILDFIDGAVARFKNLATKRGAFLDTICDRYVEGVILLGFLFLPLKDLVLPAEVWIFLALFGSVMTTYSKAAAKEKEIIKEELKKGFLGRGERMILIFLTLILGIWNITSMIYPILILAILSNLGALQRIAIILSLKNTE